MLRLGDVVVAHGVCVLANDFTDEPSTGQLIVVHCNSKLNLLVTLHVQRFGERGDVSSLVLVFSGKGQFFL